MDVLKRTDDLSVIPLEVLDRVWRLHEDEGVCRLCSRHYEVTMRAPCYTHRAVKEELDRRADRLR